ncbi:Phosphoglycerate dehydrogenase [Polaromonas sp. YR568]|uniref:D-2-hydroxyacid dehydrogenase n=1 Tax=Polaromonas sp. YR568 TaxID=1855301 RepID=UPI0008E9865B|nr:D-2-hydroxyacid dehydrogenase [Polaromonas sp. YR568]SFU89439.1 Phosphoglycerate dehydrogenase [Polaromonas sp. YR568]
MTPFLPAAPLRVYIENNRARDLAYYVTEDAVRRALSDVVELSLVVDRYRGEVDAAALSQCDLLIGAAFEIDAVRTYGKNLRLVHSTSAGVEALLPLNWLPAACLLTNSSGVHTDKAGEFGLLALLMLNDHIPQHATSQRAHLWRRKLGTPIRGKRVLIYGVGALGSGVARNARLMGLEVWGIRRSAEPHPDVDRMFSPGDLDALLPEVDFLVVTAPLTASTRGAIGPVQIARMKPGAGLVNMARAPIVDYEALAQGLREERLSGAVLDVFEPEPLPPDSPWWDVPNLAVIPHVSSDNAIDYVTQSLAILRENVRRMGSGEALVNVVDSDAGY